jgi:hypothetical protein
VILKPPLLAGGVKNRGALLSRLPAPKIDHGDSGRTFAQHIDGKARGRRVPPLPMNDAPTAATPTIDNAARIERLSVVTQPVPSVKESREPDRETRRGESAGTVEDAAAVQILAAAAPGPTLTPKTAEPAAPDPLPESKPPPPAVVTPIAPAAVEEPLPAARPDPSPNVARPDVKMVSLQTFPPPVSNTPTPLADIASPAGNAPPPVPVAHTIVATIEMPSVRVLSVKLHPDHLGELTLSLKLRDNELRVNIEARTGQAVEALRKDEGLLRKVLQSAGYDPASLTIVVTPKDALTPLAVTPTDNANTSGQAALNGGRGTGGDAPPSGQGERRAATTTDREDWRDTDDHAKTAMPADRCGDGIFL